MPDFILHHATVHAIHCARWLGISTKEVSGSSVSYLVHFTRQSQKTEKKNPGDSSINSCDTFPEDTLSHLNPSNNSLLVSPENLQNRQHELRKLIAN
jgi:hypothetical protein